MTCLLVRPANVGHGVRISFFEQSQNFRGWLQPESTEEVGRLHTARLSGQRSRLIQHVKQKSEFASQTSGASANVTKKSVTNRRQVVEKLNDPVDVRIRKQVLEACKRAAVVQAEIKVVEAKSKFGDIDVLVLP